MACRWSRGACRAAVVALLVAVLLVPVQAVQYQVTDLAECSSHALPPQVGPGKPVIAADGTVGFTQPGMFANSPPAATVWRDGQTTVLGEGHVAAIVDRTHVYGQDADGNPYAFVAGYSGPPGGPGDPGDPGDPWTPPWNLGAAEANGPVPAGGQLGLPQDATGGMAWGANSNGMSVGACDIGAFPSLPRPRAVVWSSDGAAQLASTLDGHDASWLYDINSHGVAAGASSVWGQSLTQPVTWRSGVGMQPLAKPAGWGGGVARAINSTGVIVGTADGGVSSSQQACRWRADGGVDLLATPAGQISEALAINSSGTIVGWRGTASDQHALLWQGELAYDLNDLLRPEDAGWTLVAATDINDDGLIVGYGTNPSGQGARVFLLEPVVPEPTVLAWLSAGGLWWWRRRRQAGMLSPRARMKM